MGFMDKLKNEFIDIIEWLDDSDNTLVYRFQRYDNEIKYGAKLVVREGQTAVFVNEGKIADVFAPGTYTLKTENLPVLATLKGWKYAFSSPFKAEVYFCNTRQFTDLKWGTPGPATMRDAELGAVRITAYGLYSIRLADPALFIREIVGTQGQFSTESIETNLRGKISTAIKEALPYAGIPVIDLEGKSVWLGDTLRDRLAPSMRLLGIELMEIQIQDIGLPQEIEKAMDKAGAMRIVGNLQEYTQYETAASISDAVNNPGGVAAIGAAAGIGIGVAGRMGTSMGEAASPNTSQAPPPLPPQPDFFVAVNDLQTGPFSKYVLSQMVQSGQLLPETLVWKQGMPNWIPAGQVSELASLFAIPPSIPTKEG